MLPPGHIPFVLFNSQLLDYLSKMDPINIQSYNGGGGPEDPPTQEDLEATNGYRWRETFSVVV